MIRSAWQRLAHRSVDALFAPALDRFWWRRLVGRVTCLVYHRVDGPGAHAFLDEGGVPRIAPEALEHDVGFLRRRGARFLTLADLRDGVFPARGEAGFVVCFDDGFRDVYTAGLTCLEAAGARGVVFQCSSLVDATDLAWEHAVYWHGRDAASRDALSDVCQDVLGCRPGGDVRVWLREDVAPVDVERVLAEAAARAGVEDGGRRAALARALYPSASELRRARDAGHEIGSHGHRHLPRGRLADTEFESELSESQRRLEEILGRPPQAFAYPFAQWRHDDPAACGRHYAQVATMGRARIDRDTDPLRLPRYNWPGPLTGWRRRRWLLDGSF